MKKLLLSMLVLLVSLTGNSQTVRKYINLANSASINNPPYIDGWANDGAPDFRDEFADFENTMTLPSWNPNQLDALPYVYRNDYIQINPTDSSHGGWNWFWASHHWPGQAFYHTFENVYWSDTNVVNMADPSNKYVSLKANHNDIAKADVPLDPGYNSMFPMKHNYSVSMLMSSDKEHMYLYGYFEIRSRLPKAKYTWPGFWLRGKFDEIDGTELGGNDLIAMSLHYNNEQGTESHTSLLSFALPGQTYGGEWVTYAIKWENSTPKSPKGDLIRASAFPFRG